MSDVSPRPCFTIIEAAQYLRISRALLYKLIQNGRIRTVKVGARTIIRGAELERFLVMEILHGRCNADDRDD
jgi:excisionase family DNA binding protein